MSKIHQKMAAVLAEFPVVGKDQKNPSQGYKYRGIDDALMHVHPLLAKHRVYTTLNDLVPEFSDAGQTKAGKAQVRCVLTGTVRFHCGEDGSAVEASLVGEGIDTGDKALMKAQANGLKYVYWYTFAVPTDEVKDSEAFEDPEPTGAPKKAPKRTKKANPVTDLVKRIKACDTREKVEAIKEEAREAAKAAGQGSEDYEKITEAFLAQQEVCA